MRIPNTNSTIWSKCLNSIRIPNYSSHPVICMYGIWYYHVTPVKWKKKTNALWLDMWFTLSCCNFNFVMIYAIFKPNHNSQIFRIDKKIAYCNSGCEYYWYPHSYDIYFWVLFVFVFIFQKCICYTRVWDCVTVCMGNYMAVLKCDSATELESESMTLF